MGVIYKLKPEIKDYILEQKRANPILSCRGLTAVVQDKFQIKVSKSSINAIIKGAGLNMPVGRRRKKRRLTPEIQLQPAVEIKAETTVETPVEEPKELPVEKQIEAAIKKPLEAPLKIGAEAPVEIPCSGVILLKAADYLMGGSHYITEIIQARLKRQDNDLLAKTEGLIYLPLFELAKDPEAKNRARFWALIDKEIPLDNLITYFNELQETKTIALDTLHILSTILQEVRCIKVDSSDGNILYLDGQLHTVWSTPHIPNNFATPLYNLKSYINTYFSTELPFILFMAPGYDTPTKDFFNFLLSLDYAKKKITKFTLYGNRFEEIESIPFKQTKKRFFAFGLWPWQFAGYRKVKKIGEFKPSYFDMLRKDFYLAGVEIELSEPTANESITLTGCALKTNLAEKTRLIILSNLPLETLPPDQLASLYLSHWPNLEEAFQEFSRKIELFTYTANSQRFFSTDSLNLNLDAPLDIKTLFKQYLAALDLYVRWRFMPSGYEDKDFLSIKEYFYDLEVKLIKQKKYIFATFQPPAGFRFLKELEYICQRLNEKEIIFTDGKRLWFSMEH